VNAEGTKCMVKSRHQHTSQKYNTNVTVNTFTKIGKTVTSLSHSHEEGREGEREREISGKCCYYSVQNVSPSRLLST